MPICALKKWFKHDLSAFCITLIVLQEKEFAAKLLFKGIHQGFLFVRKIYWDPLKERCQRWRTASMRIANAWARWGDLIHDGKHWGRIKVLSWSWNPKQPFINGCFNWMIPNFYIGNGCFTKHPFLTGCLGFQGVIYQQAFCRLRGGELR